MSDLRISQSEIQHTGSEDEGWYTVRKCSKCSNSVKIGALWALLNLDQPVLCDKCRKEEHDG